MILTFSLAQQLTGQGLEAYVVVDLWDNAKAEQINIGGTVYQKGLRDSGRLIIEDYEDILAVLGTRYGVDYKLRMEDEFLRQDGIPDVVRDIVRDRDSLGVSLQPSSEQIAIRSSCPEPSCGLVDKYGHHKVYDDENDIIQFKCPYHGRFIVNIASECHRLQFNCQLFNLVIGRYYENVDHGYIQVCGSDYAGFWQEQMLWRNIHKPLLIVYTPLIMDWSGAKISKSLVLGKDAYRYLCDAGLEYVLSWKKFKESKKDFGVLCKEVDLWVAEPFRLFRGYTVHYFAMLFARSKNAELGGVRLQDCVNRN